MSMSQQVHSEFKVEEQDAAKGKPADVKPAEKQPAKNKPIGKKPAPFQAA